MDKNIVIITASIFGMLAVIFGAFGAHLLKKILNPDQLTSFETGVRYQMFHALVLLVLGYNSTVLNIKIYLLFTLGIILFSFSIYGLVISAAKQKKLRFLGPITPIGGLLLIIGWLLLLLEAMPF